MDHEQRLEHALSVFGDRYSPDFTDALQGSLDMALAPLRTKQTSSLQDVWSSSALSADGYPIELTFASMDPSIRFTFDAALSKPDVSARLQDTMALLSNLDGAHDWDVLGERCLAAQGDDLTWGAWLGARYREEGARYKLYAELPPSSAGLVERELALLLGKKPLDPGVPILPAALGLEPERGISEYYFIFDEFGLSWSWIDRLLFRIGLQQQSRELLRLFQNTRGFARHETATAFVPTRYGFSLAFDAGASPVAFSLFAFARRMGTSDASIRENVATVARERGWDMEDYLALTEHAKHEQNTERCHFHNAIGCVVSPYSEPGLYISLTPPGRAA